MGRRTTDLLIVRNIDVPDIQTACQDAKKAKVRLVVDRDVVGPLGPTVALVGRPDRVRAVLAWWGYDDLLRPPRVAGSSL